MDIKKAQGTESQQIYIVEFNAQTNTKEFIYKNQPCIHKKYFFNRADSTTAETGSEVARSHGLSAFGEEVVAEMNRLGIGHYIFLSCENDVVNLAFSNNNKSQEG